MIDVDSARIGLFRTETPDRAALWIFHGDGQGGGIWMATPLRLPIDTKTGQCPDWHRLTIREDSKRQSWDLWLDGAWACAGAGFQEPRPAGAATCIFMGDRKESLALDELQIGPANPLGADADGDGFLDELEKRLGFNPAMDDREGDADSNGISNLEQGVDLLASSEGKTLLPVPVVPVSLSLSRPSALVEGPFEVAVAWSGRAAAVRYTLDGADPAETESAASTLPAAGGRTITVNRSAVLRVAALGTQGEILGRVSAAYLFPAEVARFARPEDFPGQLSQSSTPVPLHYGSPLVGRTTLDESAVQAALQAAPIVVLATSPEAWFSSTRGVYAVNSQKIKAPVEVLLFQQGGVPAGAGSTSATVSLSGETSLNHFTTPKHSLRIKWTPVADPSVFGEGVLPSSPELVLRHPTQDSWVQSGTRENRRQGLYFADAFAASRMGAAGHPTLSHRWVHVFLNGAYWGVYDAVEQLPAGPAAVLLKGEKTGPVASIYGNADGWHLLMSRLSALAEFSRQGVPQISGWEEAAAGLDQDNLIDYILVNVWMRTSDWPVKNFLITQAGASAPFRFLTWDAEQALRAPQSGESDPLNRVREAPDGPAAAFTRLSQWSVFREKVLSRAKALFEGGALSPSEARAALLGQAEAFRPLAAMESARWTPQFDVADPQVLPAWESRVTALADGYAAARSAAVLTQFTQWAASLDSLAATAAARHAAATLRPSGPASLVMPRELVITDADGDGLPDEWETRYGLNPKDAADGNVDSDGDGFTNRDELALGLDPKKKDDPSAHLPPPETSVFTRIQLPTIRQGKPVPQASWPRQDTTEEPAKLEAPAEAPR
jgi:hypothetical protein